MLIAVLADIHDNLANLDTCLDWCRRQRVSQLIVCGDLTARRTAAHIAAHFRGDIFMVDGNGELYGAGALRAYKNIHHCGAIGREQLGGLDIGFCHEPQKIGRVFAAAPGTPDFIFYGHTHAPWLEKCDSTYVANPGNLAGVYHPSTFAVLDTVRRQLELKIVAEL